MAEAAKKAATLSVADGIELGCLAVDEKFTGLGKAEYDFLDCTSEHLAEKFNEKLNKLTAWKMLKELRDLTKAESAKAAVLSVVKEGPYPVKLAEFRKTNFDYIQEAYRYIASLGELPAKMKEVASTNTPQAASDQAPENVQPTVAPTIQPFTVGEHTIPIQQLFESKDQCSQAWDNFTKIFESPEMVKKMAVPVMNIVNTINQNPDSVVNLLNGISTLLATPAPVSAGSHVCTCGEHH